MEVAASIISVASVGVKLSTTLYTFAGSVNHAEQDIADIARDVALTSNVLDSVGCVLKEDQTSSLASHGAIEHAGHILKRCEAVFNEIKEILEKQTRRGKSGKPPVAVMGRMMWPLKEQGVELLRRRLESLKTSLLLLLKVLTFAARHVYGRPAVEDAYEEREGIRRLHQRHQQSVVSLNQLEYQLGEISIGESQNATPIPKGRSCHPLNPGAVSINTSGDGLYGQSQFSRPQVVEYYRLSGGSAMPETAKHGKAHEALTDADLSASARNAQDLLDEMEGIQLLFSGSTFSSLDAQKRIYSACANFCTRFESLLLRSSVGQALDGTARGAIDVPSEFPPVFASRYYGHNNSFSMAGGAPAAVHPENRKSNCNFDPDSDPNTLLSAEGALRSVDPTLVRSSTPSWINSREKAARSPQVPSIEMNKPWS